MIDIAATLRPTAPVFLLHMTSVQSAGNSPDHSFGAVAATFEALGSDGHKHTASVNEHSSHTHTHTRAFLKRRVSTWSTCGRCSTSSGRPAAGSRHGNSWAAGDGRGWCPMRWLYPEQEAPAHSWPSWQTTQSRWRTLASPPQRRRRTHVKV